ncbi:MAG TPA: hypothetical protein VNO79_11935 [Actinomycetota bacterium]|nr:hypothetical protein [Actinomycetota bacterium]
MARPRTERVELGPALAARVALVLEAQAGVLEQYDRLSGGRLSEQHRAEARRLARAARELRAGRPAVVEAVYVRTAAYDLDPAVGRLVPDRWVFEVTPDGTFRPAARRGG